MIAHKKNQNTQYSESRSKARTRGTRTLFFVLAILTVGAALLAASCSPATGIGNGGGGSSNPGAVSNLIVSPAGITSFSVEWTAPSNPGTKADGTAIEASELNYIIYYLSETAILADPNAESPTTAESIRENANTKTKRVGSEFLSTTIGEIAPGVRYFVAIASYYPLALDPIETISSEVAETTLDDVTTPPGAATNLNIADIAGTSFKAQWAAPLETETGTKVDGTALDASDIGYVIYYLAGTADQTDQTELDVASVIQDENTKKQQASGVTSTTIPNLEPDTLYFVTITSFNTFTAAPQPETMSEEVVVKVMTGSAADFDFEGTLAYGTTGRYSYVFGFSPTPITISPNPADPADPADPATILVSNNNEPISYSLEKQTGPDFKLAASINDEAAISINPLDGVITINQTQDVGVATYLVQASAAGHNSQSTTLTITVMAADLTGDLAYGEGAEREFDIGTGGTIDLTGIPAKLADDINRLEISYSIARSAGTDFDSLITINDSGTITVEADEEASTEGVAVYTIRAAARGYNTKEVDLTIKFVPVGLEGNLVYGRSVYDFIVGAGGTITPTNTPSFPDDTVEIIYSIEKSSDAELNPPPSIGSSDGIITVDMATGIGSARYTVRASAAGFNPKEATFTITISETTNVAEVQVSTYYNSEPTETLPVSLGQSIEDDGTLAFAMLNTDVILTLSNLSDGEFTIHFGNTEDSYDKSYPKTATSGVLTILKSELTEDTSNSFSFADGAVIGISGPNIANTLLIAMYYPADIYNYYDLQAMRQAPSRSYVLKNDIEFPSVDDPNISNYEAVGSGSGSFTGSLDGVGYTITGIQVASTDNYQGLFGTINARRPEDMIVQNLVLQNFKITGNTYVGSLAGWIQQGIIDNVRVEVSNDVDAASTVTITGDTDNTSYGGGLVGRAGNGDTRVTIQNSFSAATVLGTGSNSGEIGGLVGSIGASVELIGSSATGPVEATSGFVGGLVGRSDGTVTEGSAAGSVTVMIGVTETITEGDYNIGGLVGYSVGTVSGSATGSVTVTVPSGRGRSDNIGGLVGRSEGTVSGSAIGSVTVTGTSDYVGGLVGYNRGTVSGSATGSVAAPGNNVGGLVGYSEGLAGQGVGTVSGSATGSVTSTGNNIGGLVGYSRGGMVTGSATGDVTGRGASGDAVAVNVGGLVGYSAAAAAVSGWYATGTVTGDNNVGGLVGNNTGVGTAAGYVTGSVEGYNNVGGLVGNNEGEGIVYGYATGPATGSVEGFKNVGGLVGYNRGNSTARGYAAGLTIGVNNVGGLVGNNEGTMEGYSRGIVRRSSGTSSLTLGKTVGVNTGTSETFTSISENQVYASERGKVVLTDATGVASIEKTIFLILERDLFSALEFGGSVGEWEWIDDKWPAINIGVTKETKEQPIDVCIFAEEGKEQCLATPTVQISAYHSMDVDVAPVDLGPAVKDNGGALAMPGGTVIVTIVGLENKEYDIHFAGTSGNYGGVVHTKEASNGTFKILKSELTTYSITFTFEDGARIGISPKDSDNAAIQHVATYRPSKIHNSQDLQGMRLDITRDYVLQNDIEFSPLTDNNDTAVSNYAVVGNENSPFTGSLSSFDGASYSITGIEIISSGLNIGLFGVIEAGAVGDMAVQDLVLRDFKIKGNASVGSLAGWIKRGTVNNVSVEVSNADAGKVEIIDGFTVEINDGITVESVFHSYGGGLFGRAGTGTTNTQVKIQNASSAIQVIGLSGNSSHIGGLVGDLSRGVSLTGVSATGSVSGKTYLGGLAGSNRNNPISSASAAGAVTGTGNRVGGLLGYNDSAAVSGSSAAGAVRGANNVGGLIGYNDSANVSGRNSSPVSGSSASGAVRGTQYTGGLIGYNNAGDVSGSFVNGSSATGAVTGGDFTGGLIGYNDNANVAGSFATGVVTGANNVGGLVGYPVSVNVSGDSYATGDVIGTGDYTGGLVGRNTESSQIFDSYATGVVDGNGEYTGGLTGRNENIIRRTYATGIVTGAGKNVGGLVGYNGIDDEIRSSYATGAVTGRGDNVGGLVGRNEGIVVGYATGRVSGDADSVGGLVGNNNQTVYGYATGNVVGNNRVGGLVGRNVPYAAGSYATTIGYATGSVRGSYYTGGMVGNSSNDDSAVYGYYARSLVTAKSGADNNFGRTIGEVGVRYQDEVGTYSQAGRYLFSAATGFHGVSVSTSGLAQRSTFEGPKGLTFGSAVGEWTWVANGKWPAINISDSGDSVVFSPASEQPVDYAVIN